MIDNPTDLSKDHNVALRLETRFERSSSSDALSVRYDKNSPIVVRQELKNKIKKGLENGTVFEYYDLVDKLKKTCPNFKLNQEFHKERAKMKDDEKYQLTNYLDPVKKTGTKKDFWTIEAFNVLKKFYDDKK